MGMRGWVFVRSTWYLGLRGFSFGERFIDSEIFRVDVKSL